MGWVPEWDHLTEREQAVVARVAIGMTNREIAQELHLAISTAKSHSAAPC